MRTSITTLVALAGLAAGAFAQKPDLLASSIKSDTTNFYIGRTAKITSVILNNSDRVDAPPSRAAYFLSSNSLITNVDQLIGSFAVPKIPYLWNYKHTFNWKVPAYIPNGYAYIGIFADYQKRIAESNELNNTRSLRARFHGRPDLVVTYIGSPSELAWGQSKTLQIQVSNNGGEDSGKSCKLRLFLSKDDRFNIGDKLVGEADVPNVRGRRKVTVPTVLKIPADTVLGKWKLIAYVDQLRQIQREYWPNNQTAVSISVFRTGEARPFGSSCLGSNGYPRHAVVPLKDGPMIGRGVTVRMTNGPKSGLSLLNLGFSRKRMGALPLPLSLDGIGASKCWLYTSMDMLVPAGTTQTGLASRTIPIPAENRLIGFYFYTQFIAFDRTANRAGMTFTNGAFIRLGGRVQ